MKNFLIVSFFIICFGLSFFAIKAGAFLTMRPIETKYRTVSRSLSESEVEEINKTGTFDKRIEIKEDETNYLFHKLKETRTKTQFGWETKIDTLNTYVQRE